MSVKVSINGFQQLVADTFHSGDGRMAVLLLDIMEFDELYIEMLADFAHRFIDLFLQLGVQDGIDLSVSEACPAGRQGLDGNSCSHLSSSRNTDTRP